MNQMTYAARLRYVDASDMDAATFDFNSLDVRGADGDRLGELDGFVVEPGSGRVHYMVVDSGGWFTSRRFLVPVEHAVVDRERRALSLNTSKSALRSYPEFDEDRFSKLSDDELHDYHRRISASWSTTPAVPLTTPDPTYRHPEWWPANAYRAERLRAIEGRSFAPRAAAVPHRTASTTLPSAAPLRDEPAGRVREYAIAHGTEGAARDHDSAHDAGQRDRDDVSPHFGGRAQPGDVLGLETGGETTGLGDSAEDENKRRRDSERS